MVGMAIIQGYIVREAFLLVGIPGVIIALVAIWWIRRPRG